VAISLLVLLTLTAALSSATVVALFGMRSVSDVIVNPASSFGLAAFYSPLFFQDKDGGLSGEGNWGNPFNTPVKGSLVSFLYRAAYMTGLKARGAYDANRRIHPPEQGQVGSNIYETLYTGGIGLNVSSYLQYTGMTEGFSMPANFSFNKLEAIVYGTHVNVTCMDVTSEYSLNTDRMKIEAIEGRLEVMTARKSGGPNFTFSHLSIDEPRLEIEPSVVIDRNNSRPTLFLAVRGRSLFHILGCTFTGREYRASVSVASASSPLRLSHEVDQGPVLDPIVQQRLANTSQILFGHDGVGVIQGLLDAGVGFGSSGDYEVMISSLQTVIEQFGEAYISCIRQTFEKSNLATSGVLENISKGSSLRLHVTIIRLGGASYGWLTVFVILLLGTLIGIARICTYRTMADFDAQDAVKLLQSTLQTTAISDTSAIECKDGKLLKIRRS
jgi:hypothetical protein